MGKTSVHPHGTHSNKVSHRFKSEEVVSHGHIDAEYKRVHDAHSGHHSKPMQPHELDEHDPAVAVGAARATPHSDKIHMGNDEHPYPSDMNPEPGGEKE